MADLLPALTIHQPWAWCIAHSTKRIENRTWAPPQSVFGKFIAIHAGAVPRTKKAHGEIMELAEQLEAPPGSLEFGAVVAIAKVVRVIEEEPFVQSPHYLWWNGPLAWELDDVFALTTPIRAKGKQGLWKLDAPSTALVRAQWKVHHGKQLTYAEQERLALMDPATH